MQINYFLVFSVFAILSVSCKDQPETNVESNASLVGIEKSYFGNTNEGDSIDLYTLTNSKGMTVQIITYGGTITNWTAPDRDGNYENVVLGYDSLSQYQKSSPYFGSLIGRYGNRIAGGKFSIDGKDYVLAVNNDPNHLHGGIKGFDKVIWDATTSIAKDSASLNLVYTSPDGEEGYPGDLETKVTYTLNNEDVLKVKYEARTSKKTVVNLTQHSYFNLSGDFSQDILDHELMIEADHYLPVDKGLIPIGKIAPVKDGPFDFTSPKTIGLEIDADHEQIVIGGGYDHCWVFSNKSDDLKSVVSVYEAKSGRLLEVKTSEPGIQFYTGNFLDGTLPMRDGGFYQYRTGFCLETQHFPDSPNQDNFPSTLLEVGDVYKSETHFKFSSK